MSISLKKRPIVDKSLVISRITRLGNREYSYYDYPEGTAVMVWERNPVLGYNFIRRAWVPRKD
jgi:hypothetical protein